MCVQSDSQYKDMEQWLAYLRRHDANIFDVFFKDKDDISDDDIVVTIKDVAIFFVLPIPAISEKCSTIAEMMTSDNAAKCELYYNCYLMEKAGINNTDTLRLSFVHELSHQLLYKTRFMLFENELWAQELAADMMVGAFSAMGNDVATGKYKYVLKQLPASLTHPDGKLRASIVEFGRDYSTQLKESGKLCNIKDILMGLPTFVYSHYQELYDSWKKVQLMGDEQEELIEDSPVDYDSLPDTNLLKQYYTKCIKEKENKI